MPESNIVCGLSIAADPFERIRVGGNFSYYMTGMTEFLKRGGRVCGKKQMVVFAAAQGKFVFVP